MTVTETYDIISDNDSDRDTRNRSATEGIMKEWKQFSRKYWYQKSEAAEAKVRSLTPRSWGANELIWETIKGTSGFVGHLPITGWGRPLVHTEQIDVTSISDDSARFISGRVSWTLRLHADPECQWEMGAAYPVYLITERHQILTGNVIVAEWECAHRPDGNFGPATLIAEGNGPLFVDGKTIFTR